MAKAAEVKITSPRATRLELELGGRMRPLLFNYMFFDFVTQNDVRLAEVDEMQTDQPWKYIPTLALAALKAGAEFENAKDKDSLTFDTVSMWLEGIADPMQLNRIAECYQTAMGFIYHANFGRDILGEAAEKRKAAAEKSQ